MSVIAGELKRLNKEHGRYARRTEHPVLFIGGETTVFNESANSPKQTKKTKDWKAADIQKIQTLYNQPKATKSLAISREAAA